MISRAIGFGFAGHGLLVTNVERRFGQLELDHLKLREQTTTPNERLGALSQFTSNHAVGFSFWWRFYRFRSKHCVQ